MAVFVEEREPVAAVRLRPVERRVGRLHQLRGVADAVGLHDPLAAAPDGARIQLFNGPGAAPQFSNLIDTTFDDFATTPIQPGVPAPFTGRFNPLQPLAPLIGLWAGLTNFIPQVGGYLGAVPLLVLALTTGTTKGLIILVVYVMYMQLENRVIQPVIVSKAVNIPPFVAMVSVLIASAAAGVVGAILVTPLIAVAVSLRHELGRSGQALAETDG